MGGYFGSHSTLHQGESMWFPRWEDLARWRWMTRKLIFVLALRSNHKGMSITFRWWRAELVKHLGKLNHCLIFLWAAACIFLMANSEIESIAMTKWKERHKIPLVYPQLILATDMHLIQIFHFRLEKLHELLASFMGVRSMWWGL